MERIGPQSEWNTTVQCVGWLNERDRGSRKHISICLFNTETPLPDLSDNIPDKYLCRFKFTPSGPTKLNIILMCCAANLARKWMIYFTPNWDWRYLSFSARTRTKDKYRIVYSDHQRLELEKEFHYSRYITIRRKAELAQVLSLSERQVRAE